MTKDWLTYSYYFINLLERNNIVCSSFRGLFNSDFISQHLYLGTVSFPLPLNFPDESMYFLYLGHSHFPQRIYTATQKLAGFIFHSAAQGMESF